MTIERDILKRDIVPAVVLRTEPTEETGMDMAGSRVEMEIAIMGMQIMAERTLTAEGM